MPKSDTMGVLNLGNIALDGSKIKANASKHSAMSYGTSRSWKGS